MVATAVASGAAADVIVGVAVPSTLEGALSPAARIVQRAAIAAAVRDVHARAATAGVDVGPPFGGLPYFRARVSAAALDGLARTPGVASIEAVVPYRPLLAESTVLVDAPPAWTSGATGMGWSVAVLDSGVETSHPFFGGRIVAEACYSTWAEGTSLCPNGAPSAVGAGSAEACSFVSDCGHGTHVAGVAVGASGQGGMNGVAPGAHLIAVQVFSRVDDDAQCGRGQSPCLVSSNADILSGLAHVLSLAGTANGASIAAVNISIGGGAFGSSASCDAANPSLKAAIDQLRSIGIATVIASGNDGQSSALSAPACISSAVSVGATTDTAPVTVPGYSNDASFLTLLAPGSDITSSVPGGAYAVKSGTSMAAPHVAGAWAILKQAVPNATVGAIVGAFKATGRPVVDPGTGRTHPLIDVDAARRELTGIGGALLPGPPVDFDAMVNGTSVTLTWTPPVVGAAPTGYTILARASPAGPLTALLPVGSVTTFTTTASAGVYVLSVVATNAVGSSRESNTLTVTLPGGLGRPDPPTNLQVVVNGSTATFRWASPQAGGPVDDYVFIAGDVPSFWMPAASITVAPTQTTLVIPNIPTGRYYARVFARNAAGPSAYSSNEVVVTIVGAAPPAAPTLLAPVVAGSSVTTAWTPGAGAPASSYVLAAALTPGGSPTLTSTHASTSAMFPAVASGTYFLRVYAVNAAGISPPSNEILLVVP